MSSIEGTIFNVLEQNLKSELAWVKAVNVDEPIVEIDNVMGSEIPLLQLFWDQKSQQQPQRGFTTTQALFVVQMIDISSSRRKTTQQMQFEQRVEIKKVVMDSITDIKASNGSFVDFSYDGRIYDIHMIRSGYLTELFFRARYNESLGDC